MSTNHHTQESEQLRRLLAIKRHEVPPPGYFNDFSRRVIARIKAGEQGERGGFLDRLVWEAPWLQRFWAALEAKPALAGTCSLALGALLVGGVIYSDQGEAPTAGLVSVAEGVPSPVGSTVMAAADHPLLAKPVQLLEASSTSPMTTIPTGGPLMVDIGMLRPERAAFSLPRGN